MKREHPVFAPYPVAHQLVAFGQSTRTDPPPDGSEIRRRDSKDHGSVSGVHKAAKGNILLNIGGKYTNQVPYRFYSVQQRR